MTNFLTGCSRELDLAIQEALLANRFSHKKGPSFSDTSRSCSPSVSSIRSGASPVPGSKRGSTSKKYPYPKI